MSEDLNKPVAELEEQLQEESDESDEVSSNPFEKTSSDTSWILRQLDQVMDSIDDNECPLGEATTILMGSRSESSETSGYLSNNFPDNSSQEISLENMNSHPVILGDTILWTSIKNWVENQVKAKEREILKRKLTLEEKKEQEYDQIVKKIKTDHEIEVKSLISRLDEKDKEHEAHVEQITKAHEHETERFKQRLEKIKVKRIEFELHMIEGKKALKQMCRKKDLEIKELHEQYKAQAIEVKKSHEREVLCLYRHIHRLEKERKDNHALENKLWDDVSYYKAQIAKAERTVSNQARIIQELDEKLENLNRYLLGIYPHQQQRSYRK